MKRLKEERGSITLYVLIAMLLFVIILVTAYVSSTNAELTQAESLKRIQELYNVDNPDELYNNIIVHHLGDLEIQETITTSDGISIEAEDTSVSEKVLTVNVINWDDYIDDKYTRILTLTNSSGENQNELSGVISGQVGQKSFKISKTGTYTITAKVVKTEENDEIVQLVTKTVYIKVAKPTTTIQFSKAIGVIDIEWLELDNTVRNTPISPASYLGGLTAVKFDGNNWVTADITNSENDWYYYIPQKGTSSTTSSQWANARTSDSNAYFVWIPRYAYKITYFESLSAANAYKNNSSSTQGIVGYSTIDGMVDVEGRLVIGTEPQNLAKDSELENITVKTAGYEEYIPHPAFEFDGAKAGIWVGKFESSGSTSIVKILPNESSLKNVTVNDMFRACQGVKTTYGLTSDSHMMKNTEWGAVAYLTESKYGRNGTEVSINNNNSYMTGYGGNTVSALEASNTGQAYNQWTGTYGRKASTTGNQYGIYDMSGGTHECVAAYISGASGTGLYIDLLNAVATNSKYADVYKATNSSQASIYEENKGFKGDAVYETSTSYSGSPSWHGDSFGIPNKQSSLFNRGRFV